MNRESVRMIDESEAFNNFANQPLATVADNLRAQPTEAAGGDADLQEVDISSLEAAVGYGSLMRQMHASFLRRVAYYRSPAGGSLSVEDARGAAFHACTNDEEARVLLDELMRLPIDKLSFADLMELQAVDPRTAEQFWELVKIEGREEYESGHAAAHAMFPAGYQKTLWNIARYLGLRESFIAEWEPRGGIELSLLDMLAQTFFQYQYWLEQTIKRSETTERRIHPEYARWLADQKREVRPNAYLEGEWLAPELSQAEAIQHAAEMADRFHRMYMRTLRQLRDLRRFSPVTINNVNQVNIAT
jgi:hypothetical protein